ncbi:Protein of unknown function [Andreprevotia lacus DSM 23236]|jgi:hypothetical protein|uniref:DUF2789 domain-containing protein n=1 Tax=Andreprevotia lacus DSM 23236 TaxID=1121001 RepID=A0A1W1XMW8_9NEIS|nr:DUF2789 domain-containing protein [Andreprevotia lacus]SMC24868.1 Protein of unknown function [Andreprevotia lacus DSM 23236]
MDTSKHDLTALFGQLGLPDDAASIALFLHAHHIGRGDELAAAPFWNDAQARFLAEEIDRDGDWAEVIDELAARLSH